MTKDSSPGNSMLINLLSGRVWSKRKGVLLDCIMALKTTGAKAIKA